MRIASVEQVELGSIMELSMSGNALRWVIEESGSLHGGQAHARNDQTKLASCDDQKR